MFHEFQSRLTLEGTLTALTALRIGAGRNTDPVGPDLPVVKDALGRPYIPGSSFKGVLRSNMESTLRALGLQVDDPVDDQALTFRYSTASLREFLGASLEGKFENVPEDFREGSNDLQRIIKDFRGREKIEKVSDELLAYTVKRLSCPISYLFGSNWLASRLQIRDLNVVDQDWIGQYQVRNGVAIDRDTETAADGKLYDYQVVPAGTSFLLRMVIDNVEEWQLGMLWIGLKPFRDGEATLGGGVSRGLGLVQIRDLRGRRITAASLKDNLAEYIADRYSGDEITDDHWRAWGEAFVNQIVALAQAR